MFKSSLTLFVILLSVHVCQSALPRFTGTAADYRSMFLNSLFSGGTDEQKEESTKVLNQWVTLEYDWPCEYVKDFYTERGMYYPEDSVLSGVDLYQDQIYVTVLRFSPTVPSGLNMVIKKDDKAILKPFPSLSMNEFGICSKIQYPHATVTDPSTGYMYVIDSGRPKASPGGPSDLCPPKLLVLDLNNAGEVIHSYDFPENIVPRNTNLLRNIVLDRVTKDGTEIRYVYISDSGNAQLVVYDFQTNASWTFKHESMVFDEGRIQINNIDYDMNISVDGIAIDPNFEFVYYCPVGSLKLSQIPTSFLRNASAVFADGHRYVGDKVSQSDGLIYGEKSLFYGAQSLNAVYKWEISQDVADQEVDEANVNLKTQTQLARDDNRYNWVDSVTLDEEGYLWFTTTRFHRWVAGTIDFSGDDGYNFMINRVYVGEKSYLSRE